MNRTVQRSVEPMRLIAGSERSLSINGLTEITSIPKTTLYDIIVTLEDTGMIMGDRGTPRRYLFYPADPVHHHRQGIPAQ